MVDKDTAEVIETLKASNPVDVLMYSSPIVHMAAVGIFVCAVVVVIVAGIRIFSQGSRSGLLGGLGYVALGVGALAALYSGMNSYVAAQSLHVTRLAVVLPSILEAAYVFLFGMFVWIVSMIGNAGARK